MINIDQTWLNAQGAGPYYLNQAGTTYRLQTDVTTDGTAFAIIAPDITFDLNGHTISYDNAPPVAIANHSFEQGAGGLATSWNFSTAPNAERYQGIWKRNEVYDGAHSLRFAVPASDQHVTSTSLITLEPHVTYSVSGMFWRGNKPDVTIYVELIGQSGAPTRRLDFSRGNNRGIQFWERVFTTGAQSESYQIRVGIEGAGAADDGQVFIDDIKIQRHKAYGITTSVLGSSPEDFPGLTQAGQGTGAVIQNGAIVQGQGGATWGHGVYVRMSGSATIDSMNVTVHGANASAIQWISGHDAVITNNVLTSNVKTITSRDQFYGSVIGNNVWGRISGNTILNGPHAGIRVHSQFKSVISDNTIQMKNRYTNGFAIFARGPGTEVYDNVIDQGHGDFSGRGINISGTSAADVRVYNNTVNVQARATNQEYGGFLYAYGIQCEATAGADIFGNTVTVFARDGQSAALRLNNNARNLHVYDNTFRAIQVDPAHLAHSVSFQNQAGNLSNLFDNNTLISNSTWVGLTEKAPGIIWHRTRFQIEGPVTNARWFESTASANNSTHAIDWTWVDNVYHDAAARQAVEQGRWWRTGYPQTDLWSSYVIAWSTTIRFVGPSGNVLNGGDVAIRNRQGEVSYVGVTDSAGRVHMVLPEFRAQGVSIQGYDRIDYNDYTVNFVSGGLSANTMVTADEPQVIQISAE